METTEAQTQLANEDIKKLESVVAIFVFGEMDIFQRIGKATATSHIKDQEQYEITLLSTEARACSCVTFLLIFILAKRVSM